MPAVSKRTAHKVVACLMVIGICISAAGLRHQRVERDETIDWQQVSGTLMEMETAKRDLHQSLQQRLTSDQPSDQPTASQ